MRKIIEFSLRLQFLIIILAAILIVFGITQLRDMPIDVFPEFDPPMVEVQTEALGLSTSEVESMITLPLEANMLNGIAWLDRLSSESVAGMSSIKLLFEPGTDPIRARQMVQERLGLASQLPNVSKQPPTVIQPLSTTNRVMMVGLTSKNVSLIDLGVLARWNIKPRLMGVSGVANVSIWGNRDRQLQVQVDPQRLQEKNVTLEQIITTTGEALWMSPLSYLKSSTPGTDGFIDTPNQRFNINHRLPISKPEDLAKVPVTGSGGLILGEVTSVKEDHQPLIGDSVLNNSSGILLVIEKLPEANTLEITRGVEKTLEAMRPGLDGIEIDTTVFRPANYIEAAMGNLSKLILIGAVLVVIIIGIFFFGWRTALISLVIIPISLITAVFILYLRGDSFNMMVLAGMVVALGFIIDDAIIDVDNISRRLRQDRQLENGKSSTAIILNAALEMRSPLVFATLIILLAVTPLLFLPELTGSFFQPLIISYVVAVTISLLVALILTPALSLTLLPHSDYPRVAPLVKRLEEIYGRTLNSTLLTAHPSIIIAIIMLAGMAVLPFLDLSVMPSFKQTDLLIRMDAEPNTSLPKMKQIISRANQELSSLPGVHDVGAHIGRAITGDQVVGVNSAQIWVNLDQKANYDETVADIREIIANYPGLSSDVQTYQPKRIKEVFMKSDQDLVVRVYGTMLEILRGTAQEVKKSITGIDGIAEARIDDQTYESQVEIEVDLAAAKTYQATPGDVRRQATTLLSGLHVGNLYEEQKVFDVVVWGVPEIRDNLTNVNELLIETPKGRVPLNTLADIKIAPAPVSIKHDNISRFVDLAINVEGRNVDAVASDIKLRLKDVAFPFEYHAEVLGASSEQQNARQHILYMIGAVILGTLLLLQAAYSGWRIALVSLVTLPIALAGGLAAIFLDGGILSLGSLFGLLTILGIAVRNGIVMVSHFHHLQKYEGEVFGRDLVLRGARERLRPVLMTALTVGVFFLPFVLHGDNAGTEIIHSMAVAILGGVVTSTLLTLFILPTLYLRFGTAATSASPLMNDPASGEKR